MKKIFKAVLTIFVLLAIVLIIATVYVSENLDRFKDVIITRIERATGRNMVVGGAEMALSFRPEIKIKDVSLANVSWGSRPQMIKAEEIIVRIDLLALFYGDIEFDAIHLIGPDIYLEMDARGQCNWDLSASTADETVSAVQKSNSGVPVVGFKQLEIDKGTLFYVDARSKSGHSINVDHLTLQQLPADNAQTLDLEAEYLEQPFRVSGKIGGFKSYLSNAPFPLELKVEAEGIQSDITGEIKRPMDLQGLSVNVNLKLAALSSLSRTTGKDLPSYGPLIINGNLSNKEGAYLVKDISATLGKSNLAGSVELRAHKNRPKIVARLTATEINQSDFSTGVPADKSGVPSENAQGEVKQGARSHIFSPEPFSLNWLDNIDAEISFKAKKILFESLAVQNLVMELVIENSLLTVQPFSAEVADGTIDAKLIIDASSREAEFSADMNARQVDLGEILKSITEESLHGGKTDIALNLSARGRTERALASTLNGRVFSSVGNARVDHDFGLAGGNLLIEVFKKMNPLVAKQKTDEMQCVVVNFDIKDGIATTAKGLAYESKSLKVLGDGTIDLKNETVDIVLSSKSTVANLLQVKGPLVKPIVGLNPAGVLKKGTSLGTAFLTGGLSLAAETIFDQITSKGSPCEIARRGKSQAKGKL